MSLFLTSGTSSCLSVKENNVDKLEKQDKHTSFRMLMLVPKECFFVECACLTVLWSISTFLLFGYNSKTVLL